MPQPFVYIEDCLVLDSTEKAIKLCLHNRGVWIPKSQLHEDCTLDGIGDEGDLIIPLWLAEKNDIDSDGEYE